MAFSISYKFIANDAFTKVSDKVAVSTDKMRTKMDKVRLSSTKLNSQFKSTKYEGTSAFDKIALSSVLLKSKLGQLSRSIKSVGINLDTIYEKGQKLKDVGSNLTGKMTLPLVAGGTAAVIAAAKVETLTVSFESLLGSSEAAQSMMEKLTRFTATTPFQLEGVATSAKMLLSFGVEADKIQERLRSIGDVAAGANAPINEIALIFGKVKASGKLMNDTMLQFSERGIPILDVLATGLGKTKAEVQDLASKGAINFEIFAKAFEKTRELKFMNQMEKQSMTLAGKWSTLVDNIVLGTAEVGNILVREFKVKEFMDKAIASVGKMTEKIVEFSSKHPTITKVVLAVVAFLAVLGPALVALGAMAMAAKVAAAGFGLLGTALGVITSPITLIIAAVAALAFGIYKLYENWDEVVSKVIELTESFKESISQKFDYVKEITSEKFSQMKDAMIKPFLIAKEKVLGIVDGIKGKFDAVKGFFGGFFGSDEDTKNLDVSKNYQMTGETLVNNKSRSDINVNLNAPKGTVKSVEQKSTGYDNVNLGFNMVGAY